MYYLLEPVKRHAAFVMLLAVAALPLGETLDAMEFPPLHSDCTATLFQDAIRSISQSSPHVLHLGGL